MFFGLSPQVLYHVVISLIGIAIGFVVMAGLLKGKRLPGPTALFLGFTVLTSATGFALPAEKILPAHIIGVFSCITLGLAIYAVYVRDLQGRWRITYLVNAVLSQYFNVFVLVVQSFQKIPALKALAPNQNEAPFAIAHVVVLGGFVIFGILALKKFRPTTAFAK